MLPLPLDFEFFPRPGPYSGSRRNPALRKPRGERCSLSCGSVGKVFVIRFTVHAVLDRHGLVTSLGHRRSRAQGTPLSEGLHPNDLWCTDYKGEFQLSDRRYCYPLTVTDYCSRYLLLCEALESNREELAFPAFERLFRERGLPRAMRSDNGVPFASPHGLFQLSKLSLWWLRLGISIERIRPGHPACACCMGIEKIGTRFRTES